MSQVLFRGKADTSLENNSGQEKSKRSQGLLLEDCGLTGDQADEILKFIAIHRHGQCPRNWRGGHDQHVGRARVLGPQLGPLLHAKPVLLVYHA